MPIQIRIKSDSEQNNDSMEQITCMETFDVFISNESCWRHQMETFSALLAICVGNSPVPGEFPAQRPVTRSFDVFFYLRLNKRLSKNAGEAGDLRRHHAHYEVIVMLPYDPFQVLFRSVDAYTL